MRYILLLALGVIHSGCLLEVMTTTAIQGEMAAQNASQGQQTIHYAKDMKGKTELEQAIKLYAFDTNHNPAVLSDLVPKYLPEVPLRGNGQPFHYDSSTGKILMNVNTIPNQGAVLSMTQGDMQNLELIRDAIYTYWQTTGRYPSSLDSLTPLYMDAVPSMSSGGSFLYDVTTGAVNHPVELRAPVPNQGNNASQQPPKMIQENYSDSQLETLVELGL